MQSAVASQSPRSPAKILQRADAYSKTLDRFHELPSKISKTRQVRQYAQLHKEEVEYAILQTEYQKEVYRRKESADMEQRNKFQSAIEQAAEKIVKNNEVLEEKRGKEVERFNKHLTEVYKRYDQEEKRHRNNEKEGAYKLRSQLVDFYEKEQKRKEKAEASQIKVGTCYLDAVQRINHIHRQNQEYASNASKQLHRSLTRNSHRNDIIRTKVRALSALTKRRMSKADRNHTTNLRLWEDHSIQKCGHNEDGHLSACRHIEEDNSKTSKRIVDFFKKKKEKWSEVKERVDRQNAEIPEKTVTRLEQTSKATFRQTVSSFKESSRQWDDKVRRNKQAIWDKDESDKDKIMGMHLDLRLANNSNSKISERMTSLRSQARKLTNDAA